MSIPSDAGSLLPFDELWSSAVMAIFVFCSLPGEGGFLRMTCL